MIYQYGDTERDYLRKKDRRMGLVIDALGHIERRVMPDLFEALVHSIVGQQISSKAHETIWMRLCALLGVVTPERVAACDPNALQQCGMSMRKVSYITSAAQEVLSGRLDMGALHRMEDPEICDALCGLKGVGQWTAEMLMAFSLQRPNILSYGDLGIRRGICMLHGHKELTPEQFARYRRRYTPYGTVASFYLWAVAGGEVQDLKERLAELRRSK